MSRFRVELSPEALVQAEVIETWWLAHRRAAPDLFINELHAALQLLEESPYVGTLHRRSPIPDMRRLIMPRTRYHLYYTVVEDSLIRVYAIWHASRGKQPELY